MMYGDSLEDRAQQQAAAAEHQAQKFPDNLKEAMRLADMFADILPDEYVVPGTRQTQPEAQKDMLPQPFDVAFTRL